MLEMSKTKLGIDHPDTLISMQNLACIWKETGKGVQAIRLLEECIQSRKRILSPDHPDTLSSCSTVATRRVEAGEDEREDADSD